MKISRRWNPLPQHWYCMTPGCIDTGGCGFGQHSQDEAAAHVALTGHEARVFVTSEIIYRLPRLQAVKQ